MRRGIDEAKRTFTVLHLPSQQRRQICVDLLEEFGARVIEEKDSELRFHCNLPFGNHAHGDTTGKARLNYEKMTFNCWVCGGGGFLWWISTMTGGNDAAARDWLAERTGLGGVQDTQALIDFLDAIMSPRDVTQTVIQQMPHYDERILDQWSFIHPYLTDFRHIPAQNIVDSRVGYGVIRVNMGESFQASERITIPHFWKGNLVGWQSRRLYDDGTPKYLSTPMMPKDFTLYNYDPTSPLTVVVEAPISAVSKRHVAHVEATFGANVTDHQLDLIANRPGDIVLWMDNDPAGWGSMEAMADFLAKRTARVFIVDSPYAADPADMSDADFSELLSTRRVHWSLWQRPTELLEYRRDDVDQEVREGGSDPR